MFAVTDVNWAALAPALTLLFSAAFILIAALYQEGSRSGALFALIGVGLAAVFNLNSYASGELTGAYGSSFGLSFLADEAALAFNFVILLGTLLAILISYDYLERTGLEHPEYYPLLLLSATGAMVMAAAGDLITLVLGLEIMSLAVYVLSAWRQGARESEEAGMKYFLLGAFASAFLIYGVAMLYGASGGFHYADIAAALAQPGFDRGFYALLGGAFLLVGLGFKVAFAPFHQWAPDVYTGAPTSVTAFMSVVVKTGAFAALLRAADALLPTLPPLFTDMLVVLVALTLVVGNFSALLQRGVKRMLAYSAVAHAGYLGMAVLAAETVGIGAAIWYLTAYTLMSAGAFAVLSLLTDANDHGDALERLSGLGRSRPGLALAMTVFLLSLAGIPLFAGFVGKVLVFQAAIQAGYLWLAVLAIVTSIVAVVYYIRPIAYMYFRESEYQTPQTRSRATGWAVLLAAAGTVALGLFPGWWYALLTASPRLFAGF